MPWRLSPYVAQSFFWAGEPKPHRQSDTTVPPNGFKFPKLSFGTHTSIVERIKQFAVEPHNQDSFVLSFDITGSTNDCRRPYDLLNIHQHTNGPGSFPITRSPSCFGCIFVSNRR